MVPDTELMVEVPSSTTPHLAYDGARAQTYALFYEERAKCDLFAELCLQSDPLRTSIYVLQDLTSTLSSFALAADSLGGQPIQDAAPVSDLNSPVAPTLSQTRTTTTDSNPLLGEHNLTDAAHAARNATSATRAAVYSAAPPELFVSRASLANTEDMRSQQCPERASVYRFLPDHTTTTTNDSNTNRSRGGNGITNSNRARNITTSNNNNNTSSPLSPSTRPRLASHGAQSQLRLASVPQEKLAHSAAEVALMSGAAALASPNSAVLGMGLGTYCVSPGYDSDRVSLADPDHDLCFQSVLDSSLRKLSMHFVLRGASIPFVIILRVSRGLESVLFLVSRGLFVIIFGLPRPGNCLILGFERYIS